MGKRELVALLNLSSWCLVVVERLFLAVPRGCLQFVIVVFPDHTHLLFCSPDLSLFGSALSWFAERLELSLYAMSTTSMYLWKDRDLLFYNVIFGEFA